MAQAKSKMGTVITDYHQVKAGNGVLLSPHATIVGDVAVGEGSSAFAGVHIRGDCAPVRIGKRTNIQENACLHVSVDSPLTVGDGVTVGHGAILHGCTIGDDVLVGMGAIVMDDAVIGEKCLIGAGALVTQRKVFPPRTMILGNPARAVRELTDDEIDSAILDASESYAHVARVMHAEGLLMQAPEGCNIWTR